MRDSCGRTIDYLRLSVTDLCNYRCQYCMPPEGVEKRLHSDILSIEELAEIAAAAVRCGVKKIRLTGGEPLVRRGIVDICRGVAALPGIREGDMTTNGILLPELAKPLREAGLHRLNGKELGSIGIYAGESVREAKFFDYLLNIVLQWMAVI